MIDLKTLPVDSIATITQLRSQTVKLVEKAQSGHAGLVQKNNEPQAVLIGVDDFQKLVRRARKNGD